MCPALRADRLPAQLEGKAAGGAESPSFISDFIGLVRGYLLDLCNEVKSLILAEQYKGSL